MGEEPQEHCPHCGVEVPESATFCRACGASEDSGWGDPDASEGLAAGGYVEDDDFDYDEFVRHEFPQHAASRGGWRMPRMVAAVMLLLLCLGLVAGLLW